MQGVWMIKRYGAFCELHRFAGVAAQQSAVFVHDPKACLRVYRQASAEIHSGGKRKIVASAEPRPATFVRTMLSFWKHAARSALLQIHFPQGIRAFEQVRLLKPQALSVGGPDRGVGCWRESVCDLRRRTCSKA